MTLAKRWCFIGLLVATVAITGCGGEGANGPPAPTGPTGTVKGKLTCNGKPVTTGILSLDNGQGFSVGAPVKPDGSFELLGPTGSAVPAGTYKVGVTPPPVVSPPGAATMPPPPSIEGVDPKFYAPGTSGVTVEIKSGAQDITIDLK